MTLEVDLYQFNVLEGVIDYAANLLQGNRAKIQKELWERNWKKGEQMKLHKLASVTPILLAVLSTPSSADNVTKASGGSIKTVLIQDIVLNGDSSLTREWITVHDSIIPADIEGTAGVTTIYERGRNYSNGDYKYTSEFTLTSSEALSAFEVRFLTFDIWGDHVRNLSITKIMDIPAGEQKKITGKWNVYSENEVSEYYASIAYIAQVRTASGQVIKADPKVVLEEARKFTEKFAEGDLEPAPEKK